MRYGCSIRFRCFNNVRTFTLRISAITLLFIALFYTLCFFVTRQISDSNYFTSLRCTYICGTARLIFSAFLIIFIRFCLNAYVCFSIFSKIFYLLFINNQFKCGRNSLLPHFFCMFKYFFYLTLLEGKPINSCLMLHATMIALPFTPLYLHCWLLCNL